MPDKALVNLGTGLCGVAQIPQIAIVLGVSGLEQNSEHIFHYTRQAAYFTFILSLWWHSI